MPRCMGANPKRFVGGTHIFFFGPPAASPESRASPKKADERGGGGGETPTLFSPVYNVTYHVKDHYIDE